MSASTHLSTLSKSPLTAKGFSVNHSTLSSILTLLGWQDEHPVITEAEEADRALSNNLHTAYIHYLDLPDLSSREHLNTCLTAVINKLEKDRATVAQLAKDATHRLTQEATDNSNAGMTSFIGSLTTWFKTLIGSDDTAIVEHYNELGVKYTAQLKELSRLHHALQLPVERTTAAETILHSNHQRHLLQTANMSLPITNKQFCYPTGAIDLGIISDGFLSFVLQGEAADDFSGYSVSSAGDINGDGFSDLLIGAPQADPSGKYQAGKTYLVFGSNLASAWGNGIMNLNSLMNGQRGFVLQGEAVNDTSSYSVSSAGDINGDGLSDLLIGALGADPSGKSLAGKTYLIFGSRNITAWGNGILNINSLMNGQRGFVLQGEAAGDLSGKSVSSAGDINGDGLSDLLIGAPQAGPSGKLQAGKTYLIFGSRNTTAWGNGILNISSLMNGQRGFVLQGEAVSDQSGISVSSAGDINGDGLSDLLIGAHGADPSGKLLAGNTYLIFGSRNTTAWGNGILNISSLMNGQRGFVLQGEAADDRSGISVSSAGDINGDGLSDLLIGAHGADPSGKTQAGKTYLVFGSNLTSAWGAGIMDLSSLMDGQRGFVLQGEAIVDNSGISVSSAGDINGDGLSDLLIGAWNAAPSGRSGAGKTYLIFGSNLTGAWGAGIMDLSSLMDGQRGFFLQGAAAGDLSGYSVSSAGDINGDGLSDLLIGAYGSDSSGKFGTGKIYLVFGSSFPAHVTANYLRISVGETVQLTPQLLAVTSIYPDSNLTMLRITVDNVKNGYFAFSIAPSMPVTSFYMQNISDGFIQFVHTGSALAPRYRIVVNFALRPLLESIYSDAQIDFLGYRSNLINNQLSVNQGFQTVVKSSDLSVSDQDNVADNLFFVISNLTHGQFAVYNPTTNTTTPATQFTQKTVLDGNIRFIHDGSRNKPSYFVTVNDTKSTTDPQGATITFNYAPEMNITTSAVILDQGQATTLRLEDISATDLETFADTLIIYVTNVTHGHFAYASNLNRAITAFQQLSLTTDTVQFVQSGSSSTPTFALCAFDNILYSPWQSLLIQLNHRPVLQGSISDHTVLQSKDFNFTLDPTLFSDPDNDTLTYTARLVGGAPLPLGITFTPPGQFAGRFPTVNSFRVEVEACDPRDLTAITSFTLSISSVSTANYSPTLINNQLFVIQGAVTVLGASDLSASDQDNLADALFFMIDNLKHGQFNAYTPANVLIRANISQFSQQDVFDRRIQFMHDGSRHAPGYTVAVTDRNATTNSQAATINFHQAPELSIKPLLTLDQKQPTTLDLRDVSGTGVEAFEGALIIETANISHGYFIYKDNLNLPMTIFQRLSLITATVQFVHNDSDLTPSFALRAFDGLLYTPWQTPQIYLNRKPVLQGAPRDQSEIQGEDFSFTLENVRFSDPDKNDTLRYRAQLKGTGTAGGSPLPPEIQFTPPARFSGKLPSVGSFHIEIEAIDPRGLKASTSFILSSHESVLAQYRTLYTAASGIAGTGLGILGYLWLRKRIRKHRQDFPFANVLREVLNLKYYNFMQFDGEVYKTKMENFLQCLRFSHDEFYTRLKPEERNSFAVCVAEILVNRGLVSRSGLGGGLFSCLCLFSVGWPLQLDIEKFDLESKKLASDAVAEWKACTKPLERWCYTSPKVINRLKALCCAWPSRAKPFSTLLRLQGELALEPFSVQEMTIEPVEDQKVQSSAFEALERKVHSLDGQLKAIAKKGNASFSPSAMFAPHQPMLKGHHSNSEAKMEIARPQQIEMQTFNAKDSSHYEEDQAHRDDRGFYEDQSGQPKGVGDANSYNETVAEIRAHGDDRGFYEDQSDQPKGVGDVNSYNKTVAEIRS